MNRELTRPLSLSKTRAIDWIRKHEISHFESPLTKLSALMVSRSILPAWWFSDAIFAHEDIMDISKRHAGVIPHKLLRVSLVTPREGRQMVVSQATDRLELSSRLEPVIADFPENITGSLGRSIIVGARRHQTGFRHIGYTFDMQAEGVLFNERKRLLTAADHEPYSRVIMHVPLVFTRDQQIAQAVKEELASLNPTSIPVELGPAQILPVQTHNFYQL